MPATRKTSTRSPKGRVPRARDLGRFAPLPMLKALAREQCVRHLELLAEIGIPHEAALQRTAEAFRFSASPRSLRRWELAYARKGFPGMFEDKAGRSGRKPGGAR